MSVLDRTALEASPLADLHTIASELSIDGYRRLRRAELIGVILDKQGGGDGVVDAIEPVAAEEAAPAEDTIAEDALAADALAADALAEDALAEDAPTEDALGAETPADEVAGEEDAVAADGGEPTATDAASEPGDEDDEPSGTRRRRGRRGGRGRSRDESSEDAAPVSRDNGSDRADGDDDARETTSRRSGRSRSRAAREETPEPVEAVAEEAETETETAQEDEPVVEGVVELLANGSGFVRVSPPDPSDDDVYISSAQVKRCELVSGDRVTGPKRAPRRSERFASLIRIEMINGRPAAELADSVRFDDLPAAFPDERLKIGSEDPTLKAIEWLTPFGKGSRVTITGASRAGKTEALRRLAAAFADREELTVSVVLAGVRPEEISEWGREVSAGAPVAAISFAASEDARNGAIEPVIDQARRLAARGTDAVVLIDTLDGCSPQLARKVMASARNIVDGGSVTVIATSSEPVGGETTVISLAVALTSIGRFPALDLTVSGTMRPELLLGEAGAEAIARTRAEAAGEE
jgi:transcription termination factor Rho